MPPFFILPTACSTLKSRARVAAVINHFSGMATTDNLVPDDQLHPTTQPFTPPHHVPPPIRLTRHLSLPTYFTRVRSVAMSNIRARSATLHQSIQLLDKDHKRCPMLSSLISPHRVNRQFIQDRRNQTTGSYIQLAHRQPFIDALSPIDMRAVPSSPVEPTCGIKNTRHVEPIGETVPPAPGSAEDQQRSGSTSSTSAYNADDELTRGEEPAPRVVTGVMVLRRKRSGPGIV
ncbi:hypothetical protein FSPOR_11466 [Fusarium sporotrichioides]|uniref:Uncharacterized protein n=1 Tax=Fusarium sporotrichioides TaxID=5514 RepID=A0A395RHG0_FUSSP|nr:hypothetical protein FSPOR_11466 [Fusarium sporotrichioides]